VMNYGSGRGPLVCPWSQEPVVLQKNTVVGKIEETNLVDGQDPNTSEAPRLCRMNSTQEIISGQSRREELQSRLDVGSCCSKEERISECLVSLNHMQRGTTDLVEHVTVADRFPIP